MTSTDSPTTRTAAEQLLWSYGVTHASHIDLEAIARDQGAEVRYRSLGGCAARLVAQGDRAVISVDTGGYRGRQRFSLAHELAHWIWDRNRGSFLCADDDIGPQNAQAKSIEAQANGHASQLVLPSYLVDPWLQDKKLTLDSAGQLSSDFGVSLTAAAIKMIKRAPSGACLVCYRQSGFAWCQRSRTFAMEYFIHREAHQDTDAFRMLFGAMNGLSRPKREPANRWLSGHDARRRDITSQSVKLPDGSVLSMLSL